MQTIQMPAPANDVVFDFDVLVSTPDGKEFSSVVPVRLTFAESEGITALSDRAMAEAVKRAKRIATRDFPDMVKGRVLVTSEPEFLHASLVREGERPRWRRA
jgi:hypothetical protein